MIEVQHRVLIIPAEHAKDREIAAIGIVAEMGKRYGAVISFAIGRDEKEVVELPRALLGFVSRGSSLDRKCAEDPPEKRLHRRVVLRDQDPGDVACHAVPLVLVL